MRSDRLEGDNERIGELAAAHFLERGYRNFAWAPFLNDTMNIERHAGFANALRRLGHTCVRLPLAHAMSGAAFTSDWQGRRARIQRELSALPKPLGVFAYNDYLAADIIDACMDTGLQVPEQVAVLGVDNDPNICECSAVPISSVIHDLERMAYVGAELLDRLMDGGKAPEAVIRIQPHGVVMRASTNIKAVDNIKVAMALRFISSNHGDQRMCAEAVAAAGGVSRRQMERLFVREVGHSIHDEMVATRLAHVKDLLRRSNLSMAEIAGRTGFTRPGYLHRVFLRRFGVTPARYRDNGAAAI